MIAAAALGTSPIGEQDSQRFIDNLIRSRAGEWESRVWEPVAPSRAPGIVDASGPAFQPSGHMWIGKEVARVFPGHGLAHGTVTAWLPAEPGGAADDLWRIVHEDGDEEDLEAMEVESALWLTDRIGASAPGLRGLRVGSEVEVRWPADKRWYPATVAEMTVAAVLVVYPADKAAREPATLESLGWASLIASRIRTAHTPTPRQRSSPKAAGPRCPKKQARQSPAAAAAAAAVVVQSSAACLGCAKPSRRLKHTCDRRKELRASSKAGRLTTDRPARAEAAPPVHRQLVVVATGPVVTGALGLLDEQLQLLLLSRLDWPSASRLGQTCKSLTSLGRSDWLWRPRLAAAWRGWGGRTLAQHLVHAAGPTPWGPDQRWRLLRQVSPRHRPGQVIALRWPTRAGKAGGNRWLLALVLGRTDGCCLVDWPVRGPCCLPCPPPPIGRATAIDQQDSRCSPHSTPPHSAANRCRQRPVGSA